MLYIPLQFHLALVRHMWRGGKQETLFSIFILYFLLGEMCFIKTVHNVLNYFHLIVRSLILTLGQGGGGMFEAS